MFMRRVRVMLGFVWWVPCVVEALRWLPFGKVSLGYAASVLIWERCSEKEFVWYMCLFGILNLTCAIFLRCMK